MPTLFSLFGTAKKHQPGLDREVVLQIDNDEIEKEVQRKLKRHRMKRMRQMQTEQT